MVRIKQDRTNERLKSRSSLFRQTKVRSAWSASARGCALENTFQSRDNITVTVVTDIAQLILMLVGLLRSRQTKHGLFRHLYMQVRRGHVTSFRYRMLKRRLGLDMAISSDHCGSSRCGR